MKSYRLVLIIALVSVSACQATTVAILASDWGYAQADLPDAATAPHQGLYWVGMTSTGPWRLYLKFDLPAEIGSNHDIVSVVYKQQSSTPDSGMDGKVTYCADDSWSGSTLTWNNKPEASGESPFVDVVAGWAGWDKTGEINGIFSEDGGQTVTLEYKAASENPFYYNWVAFDSNTLEIPKLVVQYRFPAGDINKDRVIDLQDLAYLAQDWLSCNDPLTPTECTSQP